MTIRFNEGKKKYFLIFYPRYFSRRADLFFAQHFDPSKEKKSRLSLSIKRYETIRSVVISRNIYPQGKHSEIYLNDESIQRREKKYFLTFYPRYFSLTWRVDLFFAQRHLDPSKEYPWNFSKEFYLSDESIQRRLQQGKKIFLYILSTIFLIWRADLFFAQRHLDPSKEHPWNFSFRKKKDRNYLSLNVLNAID